MILNMNVQATRNLDLQFHKDMENIGNLRRSHKNPYLGKEVLISHKAYIKKKKIKNSIKPLKLGLSWKFKIPPSQNPQLN